MTLSRKKENANRHLLSSVNIRRYEKQNKIYFYFLKAIDWILMNNTKCKNIQKHVCGKKALIKHYVNILLFIIFSNSLIEERTYA